MPADKLKRLLEAKGTVAEIAERFGVSRNYVYELRSKHSGKPKRPRARLTPEVRLEIALSTGPSVEVAARYGVSFGTVCKLRREHGAL